MTLLWISFGIMLLAGALAVCWPIYRLEQRFSTRSVIGALTVMIVSGTLYTQIGSPGAPSGPDKLPNVDDMVERLAERLQQNPADVEGWKMLGRSYVQLQQFDRAVAAYEQAMERSEETDAQLYADLGEAVLLHEGQRVAGRAAALFESALAADPNNSKALFFGGIAALERGDPLLAADRWDALLALSPPPEVREILQQRVAEWRGTPLPGPASIAINVSVSDEAGAALPDNATVFIIARDPAQPMPPLAVTRRSIAELPGVVTLTDADAMIPGRTLSQFDAVEVVVRASRTGEPLPQSGDWFGSKTVALPAQGEIAIPIQQIVE